MTENNYSILDVSEDNKFITNYKAIYQAMTAKHDCRTKIFPRNIKIKLDDIMELNSRVVAKLKNYNLAGFSISINVNFLGRQTIEFSSWQEFEEHKWTESNAIDAITIVWEFNAILPKYGVPQKHVLVVKLADGLKPEEMLNIVFAGKLENIEEIEHQMYPVVARVDFINYTLGDELLHIVEEWNNGLEAQDNEDNVFANFLIKHRRKFAFALNYLTDAVILVCCINIIVNFISSFGADVISDLTISNTCEIIWVIGIVIFFYMFANKVSQWLANIFFRTLGTEPSSHIFHMNRGDINLQKKIETEARKNKLLIIGSIISTFLMNLLCSLGCSLIIERL